MTSDQQWWRRLLRVDAMLVIAALTSGIAAAVLAQSYLQDRAGALEASIKNRYQSQAIVVAATDLPAGAKIAAVQLAARQMPSEFLPADAVPVSQAAQLVGGTTAIDIRRGTPLVRAALRNVQAAPRLASLLEASGRALTIAVDEVNSQAGNLTLGDWVDLYYSRSTGGGATLIPLLQRVQVLAVGDVVSTTEGATAASRDYRTITLALSADDAVRIVLAQQSGSIAVVLRGDSDASVLPLVQRHSSELLRRWENRAAAASAPVMELLVGGNGTLMPDRSWLQIGHSRSQSLVERS